ncbi:MAG TPA: hypothetical protein VHC00_01315 [Rhizobiaceae bacterium]|nr:hypothetical protein [Rhizobiaceae bacterium]
MLSGGQPNNDQSGRDRAGRDKTDLPDLTISFRNALGDRATVDLSSISPSEREQLIATLRKAAIQPHQTPQGAANRIKRKECDNGELFRSWALRRWRIEE